MIVIGIDPGLNGGVGFLGTQGTAFVVDLPTIKLPGTGLVRRRIDGRGLADQIRSGVPVGEDCLVVIEQVRAMGGKNNSVQTQGSLMRTLGAIEGVLDVMRLKPHMVEPQTWKRFYKLGKKKADSLTLARKLFPGAPLHLALHHNRAESLLLAHWGLRCLT